MTTAYFSELDRGAGLLQKKFGNLELATIAVIAVRLYPLKGIANFRRNPEFKAAYYIFSDMLGRSLQKEEFLLEYLQNSNILKIIFSDSGELSHVMVIMNRIKTLLRYINLSLIEEGQALSLAGAVGIDYGATHFSRNCGGLSKFLWLGDVLERAEVLCNNASRSLFPDFLVTHAVYCRLTKEKKIFFHKAYYINHIACYGGSLENMK